MALLLAASALVRSPGHIPDDQPPVVTRRDQHGRIGMREGDLVDRGPMPGEHQRLRVRMVQVPEIPDSDDGVVTARRHQKTVRTDGHTVDSSVLRQLADASILDVQQAQRLVASAEDDEIGPGLDAVGHAVNARSDRPVDALVDHVRRTERRLTSKTQTSPSPAPERCTWHSRRPGVCRRR